MEVKEGYRQTEVGIIPEDWDVTTIGNVADTSSGTTPSRSLGERYYNNGTIAWVKTLDLNNSEIFSTDEKVTPAALTETVLRVHSVGTVLVAMYGGFNQIGRTGLLRVPATVNQALTAIRPHTKVLSSQYLLRVLNHRVNYWKSVASSSRKDPNITGKDVRDFPLALPKIEEQEAIAEVLSDADAFIEALEQLLAKKRQVKQGAMQQLLTGKRRLPGFSGKWEIRKLGEITEIVSGGTPSTRIDEYWNGNINWCIPTDITSTPGKYLYSTEKRITELGLKNSSATLLPKGTLLLCSRATIGEIKIAADVISTNQGFKSLVCSDQVYNEFLYYLLLTMKSMLIEKAIGSTFLEITKKETSLIEIRLPTVPEQIAIAEILSDMDAEIAALEAKLAKARKVKQGMMQELLTGRIRLVESGKGKVESEKLRVESGGVENDKR